VSTAWAAVFWGAFSSVALFLGQWLARPLAHRERATGLLMGFGAGTMLSAVAYELIPLTDLDIAPGVGIGCLVGALTYFLGDRLVEGAGGGDRGAVSDHDEEGSGMAMFLGALLDGVPEAFILGVGIAFGEGVSVAFVAAVFVSNVPQGAAGTIALRATGTPDGRITQMWALLTVASASAALLGYGLADAIPDQGVYAQAFAGGAVLVMLANSMMPEAFKHGGTKVGLLTVVGYLAAAALTVLGG